MTSAMKSFKTYDPRMCMSVEFSNKLEVAVGSNINNGGVKNKKTRI